MNTSIAATDDEKPIEYTVRYGDREFRYHLCYLSSHKKRSVRVHVHPNGRVQVDAPNAEPLANIKAAVQRRARWVLKHLDEIEQRNRYVRPNQWVSGESMRYLGRRYVLKVMTEPAARRTTCKLIGGQLRVQGQDLNPAQVQKAVQRWYRERAETVFARRLTLMVDRLPWASDIPNWRMVEMQTQWGSCSPEGSLLLNPHLVKAPTLAIDYVLLHELCHLEEHNHSARFYSLLDRYLPEWRSIKEKLDGEAELILR
ncbi:M48 family metallopeptidase [Gilvimarinus agarilyticus]|uniref:M48 family metallopeptidase n=1 Tax=Gilvimarinus sp. 2_MG-2023 TaxID=3062666 RepID=UPI001C0A5E65|nr:SprT family zinc-dependent metalloprotease [Gilvimarinus sp. 2_MG-2023]MBU2887703.1 M48 family metallopeptidase [Gilvimarinus agarilyticus]MDO6572350.1 SprT family zinc-dependent metalloprotease [Gilvimarinus sp. 2_MG-2023]